MYLECIFINDEGLTIGGIKLLVFLTSDQEISWEEYEMWEFCLNWIVKFSQWVFVVLRLIISL